ARPSTCARCPRWPRDERSSIGPGGVGAALHALRIVAWSIAAAIGYGSCTTRSPHASASIHEPLLARSERWEGFAMITLYFAPRTRAVRGRWLLEELGLPYELRRVPFQPPSKVFAQDTPLGKFPVIEDDGMVMCESGAIVEYVVERYGNG